MDNDVIAYLMNIAFDNKIVINFFDNLDPNTPPGSDVETRRIAMNSRWHNKSEIPFQLAHELGHILSDQQSTKILYFTPYKYGMELEANEYAIDLLLPLYLKDKEKDDVNSHEFMSYFNVPYHLEDVVIREIKKLL
ncbi:hypothetical protein CPEBRM1_ABPJDJAI_01088 [Companilactobacillus paralimentarius]|uniref:ImmA/IrrE family metallo-endopeptidase n=1 Tax=Companilactobacillus paralimentarius TaxID=83526 RepID=UPI00384B9D59